MNSSRALKLFLVACFFLAWAGCLDKIEFERPETIDNGIAIQGKLVKGNPNSIRVSIQNLFNFKVTISLDMLL